MSDFEQSDAIPSAAKVVKGEASATGPTATGTGTGRVRYFFSFTHLSAAAHFAEELRRHEGEYAGAGWGPHVDICSWNASAVIILSFSAIEASVD